MKNSASALVLWIFGLAVCLVFASIVSALFRQDPSSSLEEAETNYKAGESATTSEGRERAFNRALELYASLEETYHPTMGNGKLYYNLANTFYQLEAYPWALLNAYRAQALRPRDERVQTTIDKAKENLKLSHTAESSPFQSLLFFHTKFSLPERIQIFCFFVFLAFLTFSLCIWSEKKGWRAVGVVCTAASALWLASLGYSYYLAPIEGVLIRSTLLYRDAGKQYAPVNQEPVPSGEKLSILDTAARGEWLKVETPDETIGFIPADSVRLISA
jgi:hypothetical protein